MGVYREYQRKLWDPLATPIISADGMGGKVGVQTITAEIVYLPTPLPLPLSLSPLSASLPISVFGYLAASFSPACLPVTVVIVLF